MTLWQDVLLSRRVDDDELAWAFASALAIPPGTVRVVSDIMDAPPVSDHGV